ncbi:MAG: hypothetical protein QW648_02475 [Nanoarchaeales archaeon]
MDKIYFDISYIPRNYQELARSWGLGYMAWGAMIAFVVSFLLITAIVWLGLMLSFGRLAKENETIKNAFIIIAGAIGFIATYGAAEFIVSILSNLIYLVTMFVAVILLFAVGRALWAGVPAAGATVAKAKKLEYEAKKELEKARREYEEERHARMLALKKMIDELSSSLEITEKILDNIISNLSNLPGGIQAYGHYIRRLEELKQKINNSKGKPSAMYATLNEAIYILEEILEIPELSDKIKNNLKNVIDRIRKAIKIERGK